MKRVYFDLFIVFLIYFLFSGVQTKYGVYIDLSKVKMEGCKFTSAPHVIGWKKKEHS